MLPALFIGVALGVAAGSAVVGLFAFAVGRENRAHPSAHRHYEMAAWRAYDHERARRQSVN